MKRNNNSNRSRKVVKRKRVLQRRPQRNLSRITSTRAPVALSNKISFSDPQVSSMTRGRNGNISCRVRHREMIAQIHGSTNFSVATIPVQPALPGSFPWLAQMAILWEEYHFNRISYVYLTRSSTTFIGSVIMAPDYDASDSAPTTYSQMSTYQNSVSDAPWKDIRCVLSPRSTQLSNNNRYTRSGVLGSNLDIKTYDVANLYIATEGQVDTNVVGVLWVEYDITLEIPQQQQLGLNLGLSAGFYDGAENGLTTALLGETTDVHTSGGPITIDPLLNVITVSGLIPGLYYMIVANQQASTTLTGSLVLTLTSGAIQFDQLAQSKATLTETTVYSFFCESYTVVFVASGITTWTGPTETYMWITTYIPDPNNV